MIVETMTRDEVFREIQADDDWCAQRCIGLAKKYNKALKNKRIGHNSILGMVEYITPNHNKVHGIVQKVFVDDKQKYAIPAIVTIYEFVSSDGKRRHIYPLNYMDSNRLQSLIVFSDHAVQRLRERCGKSMMDLFVDLCVENESCMSFIYYDYNGKDDEHLSVIGDTILLAKDSEWGKTVTTILNKNQLYENQEDMNDFLQRHIEGLKEYNKEKYEECPKQIAKIVATKAA